MTLFNIIQLHELLLTSRNAAHYIDRNDIGNLSSGRNANIVFLDKDLHL